MREILFRGKTDKGEWVQGVPFFEEERCYIIEDLFLCDEYACTGAENQMVIPETVGQCTGLTDKNGTKIFEGDIVKFGQNLYQITFECGSFALLDKQGLMIAKIGGINDHCYSLMNLHLECCWEDNWAYDIEIIGNIHDNPELLRGDNNA